MAITASDGGTVKRVGISLFVLGSMLSGSVLPQMQEMPSPIMLADASGKAWFPIPPLTPAPVAPAPATPAFGFPYHDPVPSNNNMYPPALGMSNTTGVLAESARNYQLGRNFWRGENGHPRDQGIAIGLLRKSAQANYPPALYQLGKFYLIGHGMAVNEKAGVELLRKAWQLGFSNSEADAW